MVILIFTWVRATRHFNHWFLISSLEISGEKGLWILPPLRESAIFKKDMVFLSQILTMMGMKIFILKWEALSAVMLMKTLFISIRVRTIIIGSIFHWKVLFQTKRQSVLK